MSYTDGNKNKFLLKSLSFPLGIQKEQATFSTSCGFGPIIEVVGVQGNR
jgi:hypothetical protein